jgi:predicted HicB family RNase H-like nuclease
MSDHLNKSDKKRQRFSGQVTLRIPRDLHRDLVTAARDQGVSVNHFASVALARAVVSETKTCVSPGDRAYAEIWGESLD